NLSAAGDAVARQTETACQAGVERIGSAALDVLRLNGQVCTIDPIRLLYAENGVHDLLRSRLGREDRSVGVDYPRLIELRDLQMLIRAGIFDLPCSVVNPGHLKPNLSFPVIPTTSV